MTTPAVWRAVLSLALCVVGSQSPIPLSHSPPTISSSWLPSTPVDSASPFYGSAHDSSCGKVFLTRPRSIRHPVIGATLHITLAVRLIYVYSWGSSELLELVEVAGRPGFPVLIVRTVSVDLKQHLKKAWSENRA